MISMKRRKASQANQIVIIYNQQNSNNRDTRHYDKNSSNM